MTLKTSVDKSLAQTTDQADQEKAPRLSLVVCLDQSFYKANQQQKKLFVSIDKTLAELHGFRKDMQVYVRKIDKKQILSLPDYVKTHI